MVNWSEVHVSLLCQTRKGKSGDKQPPERLLRDMTLTFFAEESLPS